MQKKPNKIIINHAKKTTKIIVINHANEISIFPTIFPHNFSAAQVRYELVRIFAITSRIFQIPTHPAPARSPQII